MATEENKIDIGHSVVEVEVVDKISIDRFFTNMVEAAVYSIQMGEDHIPTIEPEVLNYLLDDDYVI